MKRKLSRANYYAGAGRIVDRVHRAIYFEHDGWRAVPWWHPRRWFGYQWRRWEWDAHGIGAHYDGEWRYADHDECARDYLQQEFGK